MLERDFAVLRKLDMNLFIVLHALMEERSVTRTGERLGKTQSAISNALKRLRQRFGDPLFVMTPQGLVPTPRAEELQAMTREIVRLAERCLERDSEVKPASSTASFAVGAPDRLSLPIFLPFLRKLAEAAPGLSVDLRTTDRGHAVGLIESGEIDLALGWYDRLPPQVQGQDAFSEDLVCLLRPEHPLLADGVPADLDRVLSFPHLVVSSGGDRKAGFDMMLARIGRQRQALRSVGNFTLVPDLLRTSDLIGVFTKRTAQYFARSHGLSVHPLPLEIAPMKHRLIWHRKNDADSMHRWFRQQLMQHVRSE